MTKRTKERSLDGFYEALWWYGHADYQFDPVKKTVKPVGEQTRLFRLDASGMWEQLLNDLTKVSTEKEALNWIKDNGHLSTSDRNKPITVTLRRACVLKQLVKLHQMSLEAKEFGIEELKGISAVDTEGRETLITYAPFLSPEDPKNTADLLWENRDTEHPLRPLFSFVPSDVFADNPNQCYINAAKNTLRQAIILIIADARITVCTDIVDDDLKLSPQYSVQSPWQAIGMALMDRVCSDATMRFCLRCKAPVKGRADIKYCQNEKCRKWGQRNGVKLRK